jgi:hypothetical protein
MATAVAHPLLAGIPAGMPSGTIRLHCVVCQQPFDFAAGDEAVVVRHVAYGHDFVHPGPCLEEARTWTFAEPDYDCAAFRRDAKRRRVLGAAPADGWAAVLPEADSDLVLAGQALHFEPLRAWVLVEHADGSRRVEGLVRTDEWLDEPGGAEFPGRATGRLACLGYASASDRDDPVRIAAWEAVIRARYLGRRAAPARYGAPLQRRAA